MREWRLENLGDLVSFEYGTALDAGSRTGSGFSVYGSNGVVGSHRKALVAGPGIVIGRKGSVGALQWSAGDFWPIDTTYWVRPTVELDLRWMREALTLAGLERLNSSTGVPGLNRRDAYERSIPVPPLEEQRRIAETLDTIDESIQATERVITKLQRIESAALLESIDFGRNEAQLGDVCSLLQDGTHLPPPRTSEGPLLFSVQNLDGGELRLSARDTHIPEAFWRGTRRALPIESGDICLAVVGATLGKLGVVPPGLPPFTVQRSLTVLRGDPMRIRNDYLLAVMRHGEFQRKLWQRANQTAQPGVYLGELRAIGIPSPPLDEQRRVAEFVGTIEAAIHANEARLHKLRTLRSGLAADLLSGRVRTVAA